MGMDVLRTIDEARRWRAEQPGRVALVPTMGALHAGHLAHLDAAKPAADHRVVSIFVNPTQFGPHEDFARYPRPVSDDLSRCEAKGVDAVFMPEPEAMYPPHIPASSVEVPSLTREFEATQRPGHFAGVCRVVLKLLHLLDPHAVTFGQKDYQQLVVCSAMIADLNLPIDVITVPTVREADGLALSSRNVYLDEDQRRRALGLIKALRLAERMIREGETDASVVEAAMRQTIEAHQIVIDYAAVRHPTTLAELDCIDGQVVALAAGRLGPTRLLDNVLIDPRA
jgi:pantoate--beta-alanine ligase